MRSALILAAALSLNAFPCWARLDDGAKPADGDPQALFRQLDANHDGQLSSDEIEDDKLALFNRLMRSSDKNRDGKLSADEFATGLASRPDQPSQGPTPGRGPDGPPDPRQAFKRLDTNGDGKVTLDEVPEGRRQMVEQMLATGDKDGDKALNQQEFNDAFPGARGRGGDGRGRGPDGRGRGPDGRGRGPDGRGRGPDGRGAQAGGQMMRLEQFRRLDTNRDGKVTLAEAPADMREMATRIMRRGDTNNDGVLTREEFEKFVANQQGQPGPGPRAGQPARGASGAPLRPNLAK